MAPQGQDPITIIILHIISFANCMHLWPQKQIQLSPSLIHQKTHTLCITHNKTEVRCTFHAFNTLYTNSNVCFLDPSSPNFSSHLWSVCKSSLVTDDTLVNALVISNISISGNPRRSKLWDLSLPGNRSVSNKQASTSPPGSGTKIGKFLDT